MGNKNNYFTTFNQERKEWKVLKEGGKRASSYHKTQTQAEKEAKRLSEKKGGGESRVQIKPTKNNPKPVIRDSDTVKKGNESPKKDTKF